MNRLILIGNGFDLAHGMKTSYNDFILWYLKKCFSEAYANGSYTDILMDISIKYINSLYPFGDIKSFLNHFYKLGFVGFENEKVFPNDDYNQIYKNPFSVKLKSDLLKALLTKCSDVRWVDIENEFYIHLKAILSLDNKTIYIQNLEENKEVKLDDLNSSLQHIISELETYLKDLKPLGINDEYKRIFSSLIRNREICTINLDTDIQAKKSLILNFNYTTTPELYFNNNIFNTEINYIHGKAGILNYPIIFGFGDELDSEYSKMELQKTNKYFSYIKSFWYFKTSNYYELVRFIEDDEFQVYILGHSCGLSDRTMLNMIFEHEYCKSIKIFYHEYDDGSDNYTSLTQEISRHFNLKNKGIMRKKIVPFPMSEPMPQVKL